ncbi:hypothetical protein [Nocardioides sp. NPDC047086]|uniref:hypothetical protein n=1 Tax=Nocardioides sp. NPDC047086 TaxID=3154810 RepID=UPI00340684A4
MDALAHSRVKDEAEMWVDLLTSELRAKSAQFEVTKRADLYLRVGGLPLERVLDALKVDAEGWAARLEDLEAWRTENRRAYDESRSVAS